MAEKRARGSDRSVIDEVQRTPKSATVEPAVPPAVIARAVQVDGHRAETPAAILRMVQARAGNAAVQRLVQPAGPAVTVQRDDKAGSEAAKAPAVVYPTVATIGTEQVAVASEAEQTEAAQIMKDIKKDYSVTINSKTGAKSIKGQYTDASKAVREAVEAGVWEVKELRALKKALAHFAPILGSQRKKSSRGGLFGPGQEVTSISKVKQSIDQNDPSGVLDNTTMGEFFTKTKNFSMFNAGTNSTEDFADNLKQLEATAVHEMAHGIFAKKMDDFLNEMDYWKSSSKPADDAAKHEQPPSQYGKTNSREDLCESVMFYFVDPARLKAGHPLRHAYVEKIVGEWQKKSKK